MSGLMNRDDFHAALTDVAEILSRSRASARVYIVGGAAMALAYDDDRYTRDIDGLITDGYAELTEAVREVARRRGLPSSWLNEQASSYIPPGEDRRGRAVFDHPALRVIAASPERMLAMKVMSARRADIEDIRTLLGILGFTAAAEVWEAVQKVFPDEPPPERSRAIVRLLTEG